MEKSKVEKEKIPHFLVESHGSVWTLLPLSQEARDWASEHLPDQAPVLGRQYVIEHRYIGAIVEGAANDGLRVRVH